MAGSSPPPAYSDLKRGLEKSGSVSFFLFLLQALNSYTQGDIEGSKRLGHTALLVAIASILIGILMIAILCIVHYTTHTI
ncbi:transmembrane protein 233 [Python bivittatus]|uniref:Transmembrane protein 233 n=1 Tax=Python bivittatus TaxID=176946 RepID=A0A9F5J3X6_PYTBI|nr:transmembrane protein 233 [Python bivittatus]